MVCVVHAAAEPSTDETPKRAKTAVGAQTLGPPDVIVSTGAAAKGASVDVLSQGGGAGSGLVLTNMVENFEGLKVPVVVEDDVSVINALETCGRGVVAEQGGKGPDLTTVAETGYGAKAMVMSVVEHVVVGQNVFHAGNSAVGNTLVVNSGSAVAVAVLEESAGAAGGAVVVETEVGMDEEELGPSVVEGEEVVHPPVVVLPAAYSDPLFEDKVEDMLDHLGE